MACDVSDEFTQVGRPFWREAGVESKIELRLKPALQSLDELLAQPGGRGGYDFAFVDADKGNYIAYYEKLLELVRPGGLITVDNTLGGVGPIRDRARHRQARRPSGRSMTMSITTPGSSWRCCPSAKV